MSILNGHGGVKRTAGMCLLVAALLAGCDTKHEWPEPAESLPGWVYDAPYYYKPSVEAELRAADLGLDGQIPHYYTRFSPILVKRPDNSKPALTPRLAVYWTDDQGLSWHKAGHFGVDQNYFAFVPPAPGDYGLRFVGPDIPPSRMSELIPPHRVYHYDTAPPQVVVQASPAKLVYEPAEEVSITWSVTDANIDPKANVTVYEIEHPGVIRVIGDNFTLNGSMAVLVPTLARTGGMQFAVEATDKAGNISRGFSLVIRTAQSAPPASQPDIERRVRMYHDTAAPPAPEPAPAVPVPTAPANGSSDRLPVLPAPPMNHDLPAVDPNQPVVDPVDRVVTPSYRPKAYPTTQAE